MGNTFVLIHRQRRRCLWVGKELPSWTREYVSWRIKRVRSKLTKAFSKVETKAYYQTQKLSMTENNFLFLIPQKMQFLKK